MLGGRTARVRTALLLLAALVASAVLLWGSTSGESVISAPNTTFDIPTQTNDSSAQTPVLQELDLGAPPPDSDGNSLINWWLLVQIVVAALVAWLVLRFFREREAAQADDPVDPPDELAELLEATSVDDRRGDALGGEPRNAVVACWVALEDGFAAAGLTPAPSETSLDLTSRVLGRWQVPSDALETLAGLYREARFSRHPITEAERDQAVSALRSIHISLLRAAQARASGTPPETTGDADHLRTYGGGPP